MRVQQWRSVTESEEDCLAIQRFSLPQPSGSVHFLPICSCFCPFGDPGPTYHNHDVGRRLLRHQAGGLETHQSSCCMGECHLQVCGWKLDKFSQTSTNQGASCETRLSEERTTNIRADEQREELGHLNEQSSCLILPGTPEILPQLP
ncbi:uncharacterized protein LOC144056699 [Vanacampus margaritifer]